MRYRLLDRVKEQVKALLIGFYDVVPEALLSVFDFQELELLLCGLPEIDIEDWKRNTEYTGDYERKGASHKVVKWFWEASIMQRLRFHRSNFHRLSLTILMKNTKPGFFNL